MSDINPQWRYQVLTDTFGLCGKGWKYTIDKLWTEAGADGEVFCFVQISLYVKIDNEWSDAIPGLGGNMLVTKERNKDGGGSHLYNNDEAYKMALTDAIGTATQRIGVAADVYAGRWDGSKYSLQRDTVPPQEKLQRDYFDDLKKRISAKMQGMNPEERKALYTKHGGVIVGVTPDGKTQWNGINWQELARDIGA